MKIGKILNQIESRLENSENLQFKAFLFLLIGSVVSLVLTGFVYFKFNSRQPQSMKSIPADQPLLLKGGNPYLRALMRTITYSEANDPYPYNVIYGGEHIRDLSKHPKKCVPIPKRSLCSTAAGRYQFLDFVWLEKAKKYHPDPDGILWWKSYSFEPIYQDLVVYRWLNDPQAWGFNVAQKLKNKQEKKVFCSLSSTWTSLPCGKEKNVNTDQLLTKVYPLKLKEECAKQPKQC